MKGCFVFIDELVDQSIFLWYIVILQTRGAIECGE